MSKLHKLCEVHEEGSNCSVKLIEGEGAIKERRDLLKQKGNAGTKTKGYNLIVNTFKLPFKNFLAVRAVRF